MDNTLNKKVGILGGTFNPIHIGHLILAENACEYCGLDEVLIMPSGCSYLKNQNDIASKEDRINMVKLSIEGNERFKLSTIETEREGNSYTADTLKELLLNNPDTTYYYIIGTDILFSMETWKDPRVIFDSAIIVVAPRDFKSIEEIECQIKYLEDKYNARIILLNTANLDISSNDIRSLISKGYSCKYYLNDRVIDYINAHKLYQKESGYER